MTSEFVLNVSLLKKILFRRKGQRLDSAMSTICHKVTCATQHEAGLLFSRGHNRSVGLPDTTSVAEKSSHDLL
jgi:hypothetical protein